MILRFFMCLLAVACLAGPAHVAVAQQADADRVTLPFNPPLEKPLRFRVTRTKLENGKVAWPTPISIVEELRFVRSGDGFILYWRIAPDALPAIFSDPRFAPAIGPMIAPYIGEPLAFDLDASGTLLRVRDWEAAKRSIRSSLDGFTRGIRSRAPSEADAVERANKMALDQILGLSETGFAELILRNVEPLLGWGGASFKRGDPISGTGEIEAALLGQVRVTETAALTAIDPGKTATITVTRRIDPEDLRKATEHMVSAITPAATPARRAEMQRELEQAKLSAVEDEVVYVFDLATGLTLSYASRRTSGGNPALNMDVAWLR